MGIWVRTPATLAGSKDLMTRVFRLSDMRVIEHRQPGSLFILPIWIICSRHKKTLSFLEIKTIMYDFDDKMIAFKMIATHLCKPVRHRSIIGFPGRHVTGHLTCGCSQSDSGMRHVTGSGSSCGSA